MLFQGLTHVGSINHILTRVEFPPREGNGQFLGIVRPIEKHWESPLRCTQQKGPFSSSIMAFACSERDHSMLNNSMTCNAAFRQICLTTFWLWLRPSQQLPSCCSFDAAVGVVAPMWRVLERTVNLVARRSVVG